MTTKATPVHEQSPSESLNHGVSFAGRLKGVLLTGTPTVTISPADVTPTNKQVNTTTIDINGDSCVAGEAVLFTIPTGLVLDTDYTITVTCGTTGNPAQTLVGTLPLKCRA